MTMPIVHRCADCGSGFGGTDCWNCSPIVPFHQTHGTGALVVGCDDCESMLADVPFTIDFAIMAEYDATQVALAS